MDWTISLESGKAALLNGAVSFLAAIVLGALLWGLYVLLRSSPIWSGLAWMFRMLDRGLRGGIAHLTGARLDNKWRRWSLFWAHFIVLAAAAAFLPLPLAMGGVVWALVSILAIYRLWDRDEDKRIELLSRGRIGHEQQDLGLEMFTAIGLLLFFVPVGYVRLAETIVLTEGHSALPALDAALFVWGELLKAIPLVDWSEVFEVENLSGVHTDGPTGMVLNFIMRVMFDLLVLAGLLRTLSILRSQAEGVDLRKAEDDLASEDDARIEAGLAAIKASALLGRRHAIAHLFQITRGARADGRLQEAKWRENAARGLDGAAYQLVETAEDLTDLDQYLLAIEGYKAAHAYLKDMDQERSGATLHQLGWTYNELANFTGDIDQLKAAVTAYKNALEITTREASPADWAATQNNLGTALSDIWEYTGDVDQLQAAFTAYENALEVYTREAMPVDWAMAQNNLGSALWALGKRADNVDQLKAAVTTYENSLEVRTREAMPADWAATQNNLGSVLSSLGELTGDKDQLKAAVTSYENALEVRTREAMPVDWAMTQNNLGSALTSLGELTGDAGTLIAAVTAYDNTLEVRTREAMPVGWAMTQNNLGAVLSNLGELTGDLDHFKAAVTAYKNALEITTREAMPVDWAMTQHNLGDLLKAIGQRTGDLDQLNAAVTSYENALEVQTREAMPVDWAVTQHHLGIVLKTLGEFTGDVDQLKAAVTTYENVLEVRTREAMPIGWAKAQNNLGIVLKSLWRLSSEGAAAERALAIYGELTDFYEQRDEAEEAASCRRWKEKFEAEVRSAEEDADVPDPDN